MAFCILCKRDFSLSNMGKAALLSHMKNKRHISLDSARSCTLLLTYNVRHRPENGNTQCNTFSESVLNASQRTSPTIGLNATQETPSVTSSQSDLPQIRANTANDTSRDANIKRFLLKDEEKKIETFWCLHSVCHHHSLRDTENLILALKSVYPDDETTQKLRLGKSKIGYTITFGLGTLFQKELN